MSDPDQDKPYPDAMPAPPPADGAPLPPPAAESTATEQLERRNSLSVGLECTTDSIKVTCPHCQNTVMTNVNFRPSLIFAILLCFVYYCLPWIPKKWLTCCLTEAHTCPCCEEHLDIHELEGPRTTWEDFFKSPARRTTQLYLANSSSLDRRS